MSREERMEYNQPSHHAAADGDDVILDESRACIHYTILQILSIVPLFRIPSLLRQQLRSHSLANIISPSQAGAGIY